MMFVFLFFVETPKTYRTSHRTLKENVLQEAMWQIFLVQTKHFYLQRFGFCPREIFKFLRALNIKTKTKTKTKNTVTKLIADVVNEDKKNIKKKHTKSLKRTSFV